MCVLSNLRDVPGVEVVLYTKHALVREAFVSCLARRADAPLLRGSELSEEFFLCEELDGLFANGSCCEGPNGRSLSFVRGGGMVGEVLGHCC